MGKRQQKAQRTTDMPNNKADNRINCDRREFLRTAARGTLGLLVGTSLMGCEQAMAEANSSKRPNFVIGLCDDLGYGDLSCYGHPVIQTPRIDELAEEGIRFTDCYAAAPVCSPARAGMLTGRTPHRCGIYNWIPEDSPMHVLADEMTVATLVKQVGYQTCHVGKWHCNGKFNSAEQPQPGDHGFDYWFSTQNNAAPSHHNPTNFVRNGEPVGPMEGYSSTLIVDEAISWLQSRASDEPFCLFVWFHSPHEPVATGQQFEDMYPNATERGQAIYYGNVTQMDHEFGRLVDTLDTMGLRDDTFVMFTSDNGPETLNRYKTAWRSHGSPGPLRGMKLHVYEGGIRVPGIIRWPGKTTAGRVCSEPICATDLLPTICAATGAQIPRDRPIDGASILPVFADQPISRQVPLYWRYDRAISSPKVAMRHGDWKILADGDLETFELYNLKEDLTESNDLSEQQPQRLRSMAETLQALHREIDAEGPTW